jgi:hypothetical protein
LKYCCCSWDCNCTFEIEFGIAVGFEVVFAVASLTIEEEKEIAIQFRSFFFG